MRSMIFSRFKLTPKKLRFFFYFLILVLIAYATSGSSEVCNLSEGINIQTSKQTLMICENHQAIEKYKISIGRSGIGKTSEGDKKTPLGLYKLGIPRESRRFSVFIPIQYPTSQQISLGYSGSDVGIHGPFRLTSGLGFLNTLFNWTQGCVAVGSNQQAASIAKWVEKHPQAMAFIS